MGGVCQQVSVSSKTGRQVLSQQAQVAAVTEELRASEEKAVISMKKPCACAL